MIQNICIGHPTMGRGGSEATCMWIIEALKSNHNITLVVTRTIDLDDLNKFYGTSVQFNEITIRQAPVPFFMKNNSGMAALRGALYRRFTRKIGKEYDLCISAYNLSDWGKPALHFIADFTWDRELTGQFDPVLQQGARLIHKDNFFRKIYLFTGQVIGGKCRLHESFFDGSETIISNSLWSSDVIKKKYGYDCDGNVYPPVIDEFTQMPWNQKHFGYISIGRITPEKRIENQIDILDRVRNLGHDIHFHLIGSIGNDPYGQMIRKICINKAWITLEGQHSGATKDALLTQHKFAIHTRPQEAFGITVAEQVKAGCLPFIPDTGGQTEIVPLGELQFSTVEEAVQKIDRVLRDDAEQNRLLTELKKQKDKFSAKHFCQTYAG